MSIPFNYTAPSEWRTHEGRSPAARLKQCAEKGQFVALPHGRGSETTVDSKPVTEPRPSGSVTKTTRKDVSYFGGNPKAISAMPIGSLPGYGGSASIATSVLPAGPAGIFSRNVFTPVSVKSIAPLGTPFSVNFT